MWIRICIFIPQFKYVISYIYSFIFILHGYITHSCSCFVSSSDDSAAPVSQRSRVRIPYKPDFFRLSFATATSFPGSLLSPPLSSLALGGDKRRDPGNEVDCGDLLRIYKFYIRTHVRKSRTISRGTSGPNLFFILPVVGIHHA